MIERFGAPGVCRGGGVLVALGMGITALGVSVLEAEAVVAAGLGSTASVRRSGTSP